MKKEELDYTFYYSIWHKDTEENKNNEIEGNLYFINLHKIAPKKKDAKILDIGCAMGRFLLALKKMGYDNLYGCDIDKHQIDIAKRENIKVECSNAIDYLKKTKEKFDAIYFMDVLEHLDKSEQLEILRLIYDRLSENGFVYIQTPNACSVLCNYMRYNDWTHTTSFTEHSLSFILKNSGFTEINIREQYIPSKKLLKQRKYYSKLLKLESGLDDFIMSPNLSAVVYKTKNPDNIFFDRLWGTKTITGFYDYWLWNFPLIKVSKRKINKVSYKLFNIITIAKARKKKNVLKFYLFRILPIYSKNIREDENN